MLASTALGVRPRLGLATLLIFSAVGCSDAGEPTLPSGAGATETGGAATAGDGGDGTAPLGTGASAPAGAGGATGGGGSSSTALVTTTLEGVTYEAVDCLAPLPAGAQEAFGPSLSSYGGWSHATNPVYADGYATLASAEPSVYDFTDKTKTAEPDCAGASTLRRTLIRKIHEHSQKHSNGLQVQGSFPDMSTVESLLIDLRLESAGTRLPTRYSIHDGLATVKVTTGDGTTLSPRFRIDPSLYADHFIRITIPAEQFGSGTPSRLQLVAELSSDGAIDDQAEVDYAELDLNFAQMAFVMK